MISNPRPSLQLETYNKWVPKYVKHKYIVHMNVHLTLWGIVCETLKIKMKQKSTKRQAGDNLMKLHKNFYSPNVNEIE